MKHHVARADILKKLVETRLAEGAKFRTAVKKILSV